MGNPSLRRRVTAGLLIYSALLTAIVVAFELVANESYERAMWRSILSNALERQFSTVEERKREGPIQVFVDPSPGKTAATIPAEIRSLPPGLHDEVGVGGRFYVILVSDVDTSRVYLALDISKHERIEQHRIEALIALVLAGLALTVLLVWWLAGRLLAPVTDLAQRLDSLDPALRGARLHGVHPHREVQIIEGAANSFLERLDGFVQREREFIDVVSHELRTPIAVIRGAVDVLEDDADAARARKPVARIGRAAEEMSETLASLLFLAKDSTDRSEPCALDTVVREQVRDHAYLCADKAVTVRATDLDRSTIVAPPRLVAIVVANLLRNAIEHSTRDVSVSLHAATLVIEDSGPGMSAEEISRLYSTQARQITHRAPHSGIGLYVVGRICARCGWRVRIENLAAAGTRTTVVFAAAAAAPQLDAS